MLLWVRSMTGDVIRRMYCKLKRGLDDADYAGCMSIGAKAVLFSVSRYVFFDVCGKRLAVVKCMWQ